MVAATAIRAAIAAYRARRLAVCGWVMVMVIVGSFSVTGCTIARAADVPPTRFLHGSYGIPTTPSWATPGVVLSDRGVSSARPRGGGRRRGGARQIGGSKSGSLIAALLAHGGESISQDRLAEAIWPESHRPRDTLQSYVSRVRRWLGPEGRALLVRTGAGYSVACGGRLDAERFESLLDRAAGALAGEDPATAVGLLQQALDLWHGPAFGHHASDVLVAPEAVRLEELRLDRPRAEGRGGDHARRPPPGDRRARGAV